MQFILTQNRKKFNSNVSLFNGLIDFWLVEQKKKAWFVHIYFAQIVEKNLKIW